VETPEMDQFKSVLVRAVGLAQGMGLSDDSIASLTLRLGDFLSRFVDPADREQRLLKELWDVGNESERRTLARLIAKMLAEEKKPKH